MRNAHLFRAKIESGAPLLGASVTLGDPIVAEVLSRVGDFLWIDAEHNPLTPKVVEAHLMAAALAGCPSIVRVPVGDTNFVKHVLDAGADGIIAPQVRSADEARRMVAACRYPPAGTRGFGPRRAGEFGEAVDLAYPERANSAVLAFVMLEDVGALADLDAILALPGLDGVVIGPADLSASLGHIGELDHPEVQRAITRVIEATRSSGLMLGVGMGVDVGTARDWIARGVQWIQLGVDHSYLLHYFRGLTDAVRRREERWN
jgi:2-dehydro-3-deoxyglucarate aldolase/4-hydroxy-2-oxoheptanedioate aldolase